MKERITDNDVLTAYKLWKQLNTLIKKKYSRGINLPEYISETVCCIVNDYKLHAATGGSEDAIDKNGEKVQIKATSNYNSDLSSFGPKSQFTILEFLRLNKKSDIFYLYRIDTDYLSKVNVNQKENFNGKQQTGQRPRFSIIKKIIEPYKISPYAEVHMDSGIIKYLK